MRQAFHAFAAESGIGRDHRVHPRLDQRRGDQRGLFVGHVRGDLDRQRYPPAMPQRQRFLTLAQCLQQLLERIAELQAAQAGRVRRADVDGDVAGVGVDLVQADQVVVDRALHRGIEVLADVDPQHAAILRRTHPRQQVVDAVVVETHAIDDRVGLRQAEQARPGIARLRSRSDGADLDEAETELAEPVDGVAVLVQARGQPHRVGKLQAQHRDRQTGRLGRQQAVQAQAAAGPDQVDGQFVGGFRGQFEQQLAGQGVHGRVSVGRMKGADYSRRAPAQARRCSASRRPSSLKSRRNVPCTPSWPMNGRR
ncbi:Uncharacterised protein [Klebsiella pneumoniae]|nr:Uncharacterised protein [Klebsiella pneumoniae]